MSASHKVALEMSVVNMSAEDKRCLMTLIALVCDPDRAEAFAAWQRGECALYYHPARGIDARTNFTNN